ncbi:site-specific DNA-methyltransferase [Microbacterium sp. 1P06AB]|uniref:site-specific DNA-methyltransferase n=1 Tax=Microbacterium sp. 1P06AB TaxID=3132289 RepID=UPI0039A4425B
MNDLIRQLATKDAALARDIEKEVKALADRRAFGLNFERHTPEAVDLPGRRPVKGSKVRILPPRGEMPKREHDRLWQVLAFDPVTDPPVASLDALDGSGDINRASIEDLVVVAEFNDPIYPGLVSTGKVERGGDKPYHSVINAENYHALQALLFTHRGKVDCIYIDPPYNTGAKDWKYNNDYVESDDLYRHSKWLAFMERRLLLAKELLNPDDSVLIVTIDEKEYLRLGLLLEQAFPAARIQMVSSVINPSGVARAKQFYRADEYLFFVFNGDAEVVHNSNDMLNPIESFEGKKIDIWRRLLRSGTNARRQDGANQFYPFWIDEQRGAIHSVGEPLPLSASRDTVAPPQRGLVACWPIRSDDSEGCWQISATTARVGLAEGTVRIGAFTRSRGRWSISYLRRAEKERIARGEIEVVGRDVNGALELRQSADVARVKAPVSVWNMKSHNAGDGGSNILRALVPGRRFPFPKSLYAVEDAIRFFVARKPYAVVLDFFGGSGTTVHAAMRLNRQDGGQRQGIVITNNEVSAEEQIALRKRGCRPGDADWEKHGICDYITKPRIEAAIRGITPDGEPIKGDYKFTDEFPMADGFEENVEFFTLTYESPLRVEANYAFGRIAPLLWIRAGSQGRRIDALPDGWDVAETYGVISDLDHSEDFARAIAAAPAASVAFIITDEDRLFEALVRELPEHVEPVRLYEAYLRTFEIEARRAAER